jgi:hypothetical protein
VTVAFEEAEWAALAAGATAAGMTPGALVKARAMTADRAAGPDAVTAKRLADLEAALVAERQRAARAEAALSVDRDRAKAAFVAAKDELAEAILRHGPTEALAADPDVEWERVRRALEASDYGEVDFTAALEQNGLAVGSAGEIVLGQRRVVPPWLAKQAERAAVVDLETRLARSDVDDGAAFLAWAARCSPAVRTLLAELVARGAAVDVPSDLPALPAPTGDGPPPVPYRAVPRS